MSDKSKREKTKPTLHLADTKKMTFDQFLELCRRLMGREMTTEELADIRQRWQAEHRPL